MGTDILLPSLSEGVGGKALVSNRLNIPILRIMDELEVVIAIAPLLRLHEFQRRLYGLITALPSQSVESLPFHLQSLKEEHRLVVTRKGKTRQGIDHILSKISLVLPLQVDGLRTRFVDIVVCRNISIIFEELIEIIRGIHQPLIIAIERDRNTGIGGCQRVKLGDDLIQLRRTACVEDDHILLGTVEGLRQYSDRTLHIRDGIFDATPLEFLSESKSEITFPGRRIITIDKYRMYIGETLQKGIDGFVVQR